MSSLQLTASPESALVCWRGSGLFSLLKFRRTQTAPTPTLSCVSILLGLTNKSTSFLEITWWHRPPWGANSQTIDKNNSPNFIICKISLRKPPIEPYFEPYEIIILYFNLHFNIILSYISMSTWYLYFISSFRIKNSVSAAWYSSIIH